MIQNLVQDAEKNELETANVISVGKGGKNDIQSRMGSCNKR
jgi:hypothetical protein